MSYLPESPSSDDLPPAKVPRLEIYSSNSPSSDESPPVEIPKSEISSSISPSSDESPPVKVPKSEISHSSALTSNQDASDAVPEDSDDEIRSIPEDSDDEKRSITEEEREVYEAAVYASDGFDVPALPDVFAMCLITPVPVDDSVREEVHEYCTRALKQYNDDNNTNYEFVEVEKVNVQGSFGILHYLTFVGRSPENELKTFQAQVLDGVPKYKGADPVEVKFCRLKPPLTEIDKIYKAKLKDIQLFAAALMFEDSMEASSVWLTNREEQHWKS